MSVNNLVLAAALFAAAAAAGYLYYDHSRADQRPAHGTAVARAQGQLRPDFSLPDLEGTPRSIAEWDGQALIVNFWATWCPPCRREIPLLIEMRDEAAARGIEIIGIAMDQPEAVARYAETTAFNYPILVGEQEAVDAAEAFGADVVGLPLTVFSDRDGRVVEIHAGEITREQLSAAIRQLAQ